VTRFAADTSVSVEKSRAEIEKLLQRYGASQFVSGWDGPMAMIGFGIKGRTIRFLLTLPERKDRQFQLTPKGRFQRTPEEQAKAWEQACRSRWRALLLVIKAKLEAAEVGISTIEDEFMAWTVLQDGRTIGDTLRPQLDLALKAGTMPKLLLGGGGA
jgi:hypothetical protein